MVQIYSTLLSQSPIHGISCKPQNFGISPLAAFNKWGIHDFLYCPIELGVPWSKHMHGSLGISVPESSCTILAIPFQNSCIFIPSNQMWNIVLLSLHPCHNGDFPTWYLCSLTGIIYHLAKCLKLISTVCVSIEEPWASLFFCCWLKAPSISLSHFSIYGDVYGSASAINIF